MNWVTHKNNNHGIIRSPSNQSQGSKPIPHSYLMTNKAHYDKHGDDDDKKTSKYRNYKKRQNKKARCVKAGQVMCKSNFENTPEDDYLVDGLTCKGKVIAINLNPTFLHYVD